MGNFQSTNPHLDYIILNSTITTGTVRLAVLCNGVRADYCTRTEEVSKSYYNLFPFLYRTVFSWHCLNTKEKKGKKGMGAELTT